MSRLITWSCAPHFDCELPGLTRDVRERPDLDTVARHRFAVSNALDFFALDRSEP